MQKHKCEKERLRERPEQSRGAQGGFGVRGGIAEKAQWTFLRGNRMSLSARLVKAQQNFLASQSQPLITFPASFENLSVGRRTDKGV